MLAEVPTEPLVSGLITCPKRRHNANFCYDCGSGEYPSEVQNQCPSLSASHLCKKLVHRSDVVLIEVVWQHCPGREHSNVSAYCRWQRLLKINHKTKACAVEPSSTRALKFKLLPSKWAKWTSWIQDHMPKFSTWTLLAHTSFAIRIPAKNSMWNVCL